MEIVARQVDDPDEYGDVWKMTYGFLKVRFTNGQVYENCVGPRLLELDSDDSYCVPFLLSRIMRTIWEKGGTPQEFAIERHIRSLIDKKSFKEVVKTPCKPGSLLKALPLDMMRQVMSYL
jgi:hypothetical protein